MKKRLDHFYEYHDFPGRAPTKHFARARFIRRLNKPAVVAIKERNGILGDPILLAKGDPKIETATMPV